MHMTRNDKVYAPFFAKIPDKVFQLLFAETLAHPIEARTEIVNKLLIREYFSNILCKAGGLLHTWVPCLEPEQVCVGTELNGTLSGRGKSGAEVIEPFSRAWNIPTEGYRRASDGLCKLAAAVEWCIPFRCDLLFVPCGLFCV